ncbi:MAG: DUF4388 domain-containing protein [Deltaproteobacteria bacterium]|nr:DUF4388 domain-containing protein [Deltaproteobacteria bacterium]
MSELKINADGLLKLPLAIRQQLGDESLQPLSSSAAHLLLGRDKTENPVLLCGVLGELSVPDLLSFFNMFRKTGILHFELQGGTKSLYFQQGEIVFASSTFADEDLGEILFSLGKIERETLQRVRRQVRGRTTLGKLLVEQGAVSPKDLWLVARSQVEGIVYHLFAAQQGGFYYEARTFDQEQILRLSMSTQNLIMEGLRRQDERALFMRRVISFDYFPISTGKQPVDLGPVEARLLTYAETGQLSCRDLFRKAGLREFEGLRTLHALLEKGLLQMEDAPATEIEGDLGQVLAIYNSLLKVLYRRMVKNNSAFQQEVISFLSDLPQPYSFVLRDIELLEDGTIDGHRIVANLSGLEEGDKQRLLADSLCELVYMQTMAVRRELDAEQARPLIARVQEITTRVRDLVGRTA